MNNKIYIEKVGSAPPRDAKAYLAFFDLDETLLVGKSMLDFFSFFCDERGQGSTYRQFVSRIKGYLKAGYSREVLNKHYYENFQGILIDEISHISELWFQKKLTEPCFFSEKVLLQLKLRQQEGAVCIIVSGSFRESVRPIAKYLGIDMFITNTLQVNEGYCTGSLGSVQVIGEGKGQAVKKAADETRLSLRSAYAYGDHVSDMPMLELVGNPIVVGKNPELRKIAKSKGWYMLS